VFLLGESRSNVVWLCVIAFESGSKAYHCYVSPEPRLLLVPVGQVCANRVNRPFKRKPNFPDFTSADRVTSRQMTTSDGIAIVNIVSTVLAVLAAPVVALWVGGILQARANTRQQQLQLLGILLSLRHQPLSPENFRALNLIDAVFAQNSKVREAWSKYFAALNDPSLNLVPGVCHSRGKTARPYDRHSRVFRTAEEDYDI
jgi:uncharacterized protein DUF6680